MEACPTAPLPNKLSELLMASVLDAIKTSETPGYELQMQHWHTASDYTTTVRKVEGSCLVCMAGSVMVQRLGVSRDKSFRIRFNGTEIFGEANRRKLEAINAMRCGHFGDARAELGIVVSREQQEALVTAGKLVQDSYKENLQGGRACWGTYREAAEILAKAGL